MPQPHSDALLICGQDDGIVVGMTTKEYLHTYETNQPRELAHGMVREPPAPFFSHQQVALKIARCLADFVDARQLGVVGIAPIDVVLDADGALVVQPDVLFVSTARRSIIRDQVWGPPDLVVEILSPGTAAHDKGEKLDWYSRYGVREYWLVEPAVGQVTVVIFGATTVEVRIATLPDGVVRSALLEGFSPRAAALLD